jgi:general secretion pathway protein B
MKPSSTADAVKLDPDAAPTQESSSNFEEQVAVAIDNRAEQAPPAVAQIEEPPATTPNPAPAPTSSSRTSIAPVPTVDELRLEGTLQIAELHLDIHVYSEVPEDRFVFINMNKHREGSQIAEGPVVREIRDDGVVLEYQGRIFLLPRQ